MITKHDYPILEHDDAYSAVINPWRKGGSLPRLALLIFFEEVYEQYLIKYKGIVTDIFRAEVKPFRAVVLDVDGTQVCMMQANVGGASISMQLDWLYARGVEKVVCCGGCGVLEPIPHGYVILPTRALRDEGASYHCLPPSRLIELQQEPLNVLRKMLDKLSIPYTECTTWTTDDFYRETADMVAYRRSEGCKVVEMECASLAAVAQMRGKVFAQLLYSGDTLEDPTNYDDRNWSECTTAREKLAHLALIALKRLA